MAEEIKIIVGADTSKLQASLAKAESDLKSFQTQLNSTGDAKKIDELNKKIAETQSIIGSLKTQLSPVKITADNADLVQKIAQSEKELEILKTYQSQIQLNADSSQLDAALLKAEDELKAINSQISLIQIKGDPSQIDATIKMVESELLTLKSAEVPITADPSSIQTTIAGVENQLEGLQNQEIPLKADASQFNAELQKAENELKQFQAALKKTTDLGELQTLNTKIKQTENAIASMGGAMKKVPQATGAAGASITNLGRIVSDSAYGFIGIANNIQPFIDSLGYARKEAQATGTSLAKNLLSALTGPAGLSLGFAAVTTAITFAQIGFSAWTRGANKAKENIDQFKKSQDEFAKSVEQSKASSLSSALALQSYVDIAKNGQLPLTQRNEALKQANQILGEHGQKLTLANIATAAATKEVELYTQAIVAQAVASKYTDELANQIVKQQKLQKDLSVAQQDAAFSQQDLNKQVSQYNVKLNDLNNYTKESNGITSKDIKLKGQYADAQNKILNIQKELSVVTNSISILTKDAKDATLLATKAFGELGYKQKEATNTSNNLSKSIKKVTDTLVDLTDIIPIDGIDIQIAKTPFNQTVLDNAYREGLINQFKAAADKFKYNVPIGTFNLNTEGIQKEFEKLLEKINKFKGDVDNAWNSFLASTAKTLAVGLGEILGTAISKAISGVGNFGDVFKGIFETLSNGVKALGEQLIQIGLLAVLAQQSLSQILANPFAAIAAGIALVALSTAISNLMNSSKFAVGTRYAPGGMALVGERGPELVSLPRGSQVIPAAQTASMMGAASQVEVFGVLRGQDIYFSNKKYGRTYGRTT